MFPHSTSRYDGDCDCDSLFEFVYSYDNIFEFVYSYENILEFVYGYGVKGSDFNYDYGGLSFEFGDGFTLKGISNCYGL